MLKAALGDLASLIAAARTQRRAALTEPEAKAFLRAVGIPVPAGVVVASPAHAAAAFAEIGPPAVIKAVAHSLTHKSEAGAVLFPIDTGEAAAAACRQIAAAVGAHRPDIELEGFLIEAYRPAQPEWILALRNDPGFGPVVMFGLGGIYVDMLRQVSFRLAPLNDEDAHALIADKPAMRILDGARGKPPADRPALKDAIRRLSDLALQPKLMREIADIEINPLTITHEGVLALDALIVLRC
jgi:succinyl-CoA synthetase beta subunit